MAPTAVSEKKPCSHWPLNTTRSFRQNSSLTHRATPGFTDINEPDEDRQKVRMSDGWGADGQSQHHTHLGSAAGAPPSSQQGNGSSDSHLEPGRPPRGKGRCQEMTAGRPEKMMRTNLRAGRRKRLDKTACSPPNLIGLFLLL